MKETMASKFGAKIDLNLPQSDQKQLFMVRASSAKINLTSLILSHKGQVIVGGNTWAIAQLVFSDAMELRKLREIAFIGGISVDPQRFVVFSEALKSQGSSSR
jgi:hypothetical protein